jgi:hypothetical protein
VKDIEGRRGIKQIRSNGNLKFKKKKTVKTEDYEHGGKKETRKNTEKTGE